MLKGKKMSKCYWGEAVGTISYVLNRCPTRRMENVTPEEVWSGNKPSVKHLKVFGSFYYRHVLNEKMRKYLTHSTLIGYDLK